MQITSLISRLLSILAIVSLLIAPVATASKAVAMDDASMAGMTDMPDGMPCCPDEKPALPDCAKFCPMAVLCMAKCFPGAPTASAVIPVRISVVEVKAPWDDLWRDLLPDPPPPEPPRA